MPVISIANHKGGVGKTTSTVNLAAGLARMGHKVLVIDMDPQANATTCLGLTQKQERTVYQVLAFLDPISRSILPLKDNLDLVPSSVHLAGFEKNSEVGKEFILQEAIQTIKDQYDYILIDCPPSLGSLTITALTASDFAIIALQSEFLALQGMQEFIKILRTVKTRMNRELELLGIVVTRFDSRKVLHRDVLSYAQNEFGEMIFSAVIRDNVALAESQSVGQHIFEYNARSIGADDYGNLAKEVVERTTNQSIADLDKVESVSIPQS